MRWLVAGGDAVPPVGNRWMLGMVPPGGGASPRAMHPAGAGAPTGNKKGPSSARAQLRLPPCPCGWGACGARRLGVDAPLAPLAGRCGRGEGAAIVHVAPRG